MFLHEATCQIHVPKYKGRASHVIARADQARGGTIKHPGNIGRPGVVLEYHFRKPLNYTSSGTIGMPLSRIYCTVLNEISTVIYPLDRDITSKDETNM